MTTYNSVDEMFEAVDNRRNKFEKWLGNKIPNGIAGYHPYHALKPKNLPRTFRHYFYNVKDFAVRGKRGWANSDTWGLDSYILSWLPDALHYFADNLHGFPVGVDNVQAISMDDDDEASLNEWRETILKMERGLRDGAKMSECYDPDEREKLQASFDEAWALMGKNFFDLWD